MLRFAIVRHWLGWASQSGMAGHPIGEKAPIGNTDCPIDYAFYPLASSRVTYSSIMFRILVSTDSNIVVASGPAVCIRAS